jgi:hypothetical protein
MPFVDEETRFHDRRQKPVWPWVLVAVVIAGLWLLFSAAISVGPRALNRPAPAQQVVRRINSQQLAQAQSMLQYGNWTGAASIVRSIDADAGMSAMEKHQYFRVAAESHSKGGDPEQGARFYERFLGMCVQLHAAECQGCHAASGIFPHRLADMQTSKLGQGYVDALKRARKLDRRRDQLQREAKRAPGDPKFDLLLYHLSRARRDRKAMLRHTGKLEAFDAKHPPAAPPR